MHVCFSVVESDDTCEDTEARALLNKFLGASVILQGMEQGMKAAGQTTEITDITPGSAALVSRVEKQRMVSTICSISNFGFYSLTCKV